MMLTGPKILEEIEAGSIVIDPFEPKHLTPNAYDVTLSPDLLVYDLKPGEALDMQAGTPTRSQIIPESGLLLEPGVLYLGSTVETATSYAYAPMFEGRSSVGRLGINTHITAGFGDVGWGFQPDENGNLTCTFPTWTLEIAVVHPVRIYPHVRIGQVYFFEVKGERRLYQGKYHHQRGAQPSLMFRDFANPNNPSEPSG